MNLQTIPLLNLALIFLPALAVVLILFRWSRDGVTALHALGRMALQLVIVGYVLNYIFNAERAEIVVGVLTLMLVIASWIALRPIERRGKRLYLDVLVSVAGGGVSTLLLVTFAVLRLEPWFMPRFMIPLAGMIFANSMNTVSLAGERFFAESANGRDYAAARRTALSACLIPQMNTLFAVGLVSIPGMMTGQILSGVDPLIAVRYQIMVMCMIFGSGGLAAACFLALQSRTTTGT